MGDYLTALLYDNKAIELNSTNTAYYYRGEIKVHLQMYNDAINDYTKVIDLASDSNIMPFAYNGRGLCKKELGLFEEALVDYNKSIGINPHIALFYRNRGDLKQSLHICKAIFGDVNNAPKTTKKDSKANNNNMDICKKDTHLLQEALMDYNTAVELDPTCYFTYMHRGSFYESRKCMNWQLRIMIRQPNLHRNVLIHTMQEEFCYVL